MIEYNIEVEDLQLEKLEQIEKKERLSNNRLKCLETCIKMLTYYLEKDQYENLMEKMKNLSKKRAQSGFVILGMIKFSLKLFHRKISHDEILVNKHLETIKAMFNLIKITNDKNFDLLKANLMKSIEKQNWDDIQHIIFNIDYGPDDVELSSKILKKLSIESSDFNTESSTKIDNKLEISINKEGMSSTRNLNKDSPMNQLTVQKISTNSFQSLKTDGLKFTKVSRIRLPTLSLAIDITMTAYQIKKLFITEMTNLKMNIVGDENSEIISVHKKDLHLFKSLLECFHLIKKNTEPNSVQLSIRYSENKYERIVELKSTSGKKEVCENIITNFVKSLVKKVKKMRVIKKSEGLIIGNLIEQQKYLHGPASPCSYQHLTEEDTSVVDSYNKEASNFYEFYRILSQENYDLGKSVKDFVDDFRKNYKDVEASKVLVPRPMEEIVKFIEDCVSTFHCYFNFGKSNTEKMLPYCRPAVEKFIFNKLYFLLYDLYNKRYEEENKKFLDKQNKINSKLNVEKIMDYLEIKMKFREDTGMNSFHLPYKSAIDCINKIEFEQNPKDKFDTLMKASLDLRNGILDSTKGKSELNSMDDELPLFIYLTSQINVRNIVLELNMIEDYLRFSKSVDKESKVLTNIKGSVFYISNDWKIENN